LSDKQIYHTLKDFAVSDLSFSEFQLANVDLNLGLHRQLATIEAYYQYFTEIIAPGTPGMDVLACENMLVYNGKANCDSGAVFAFETVSKYSGGSVELLPDDRIYGTNPDAPLAVLYGDILTESFSIFHSGLLSSAYQGKVQYLLRYKPSANRISKPNLSGYGVGLSVKRTDYLVIDDRPPESENESTKVNDPKGQFVLRPSEESSTINKADLALLGLRAANFILENEEPYSALKNISYDFPKYLSSLGELKPHNKTLESFRFNSQNGITPGNNLVSINGAVLNTLQDSSVLSMLEVVDRERYFVSKLADEFVIDEATAAKIVSANIFGEAKDSGPTRYDYRTDALIWLNDIEKDQAYSSFSTDWQDIFSVEQPGMLPKVKRNIFSVVLAIDFANLNHMRLLSAAMGILRNPNLPIQIGLIPLVGEEKSETIAKQFSYLNKIRSGGDILRFFALLASGADNGEAFMEIISRYGQQSPPDISSYASVVATTSAWMDNLDISLKESLIFVDGVLVTSTPQWLQLAAQQFGHDLELLEYLVEEGELEDLDLPLRDYFLQDGLKSRNKALIARDNSHVDMYDLMNGINFSNDLASVTSTSNSTFYSSYWLVADFSQFHAFEQAIELIHYVSERADINMRLSLVPVLSAKSQPVDKISNLSNYWRMKHLTDAPDHSLVNELHSSVPTSFNDLSILDLNNIEKLSEDQSNRLERLSETVCESAGSLCGGVVLVANGRVINIDPKKLLRSVDLEYLSKQEISTRLDPVKELIKDFDLFENAS
jgi:UDP-glucose:glycoprotein glucosyltransferase